MPSQVKTAEEKANEIVSQFCEKTGVLGMDGTAAQELIELVRLGLKCQDRDTRHACAEAVIQCEDMNDMCADSDVKCIDADDAHKACMNVTAV